MNHRDWLTARKTGLGGTDIAAIMGIHPYKTAMSVYAEKLELIEPGIPTPAMKLGLALEPVIAKLYTEETGERLIKAPFARMFSDKFKWVIGSPDRLTHDKELVVELKSVGARSAWRFGAHGTSEVPKEYFLQVQWYLMILNLGLGHLAALIGGNEFRIFNIESDKELQDMMLDLGARFWTDHILKKVPPPPSGLPVDTALIKRLNQQSSGEMKAAFPETEELMISLAEAKAQRDFQERKIAEFENRIKLEIGDADGIEGLNYIATWKKTKDGTNIDWEKVAKDLRDALEYDAGKDMADNMFETYIREHTKPRPGSRRFLLKKKNGGK